MYPADLERIVFNGGSTKLREEVVYHQNEGRCQDWDQIPDLLAALFPLIIPYFPWFLSAMDLIFTE